MSTRIHAIVWLAQTFIHHPGITLSQIQQKWLSHPTLSEGKPLIRSSFNNYRIAVEDLFGITVHCDRATNGYTVIQREGSAVANWLLHSLSVGLLTSDADFNERYIMVHPQAEGIDKLYSIAQALRQECALEIQYLKYDGTQYICTVRPYGLRQDKERWYLLGLKDNETQLKTFATDRMVSVTVRPDIPFTRPTDFSLQEFYRPCVGIIRLDAPEEVVRLRVRTKAIPYLRSAPLHPSQQEEIITPDALSIFTYYFIPSPDILQRLCDPYIEVLAPQSLREQIADRARQIADIYSN